MELIGLDNNVVVLMSTYNGENYIKQQIQSILNQTIDCMIYIRDDGSTDNTKTILHSFDGNNRIKWKEGNNIGFVASFFWLMKNAPKANYYALADQDDMWLPMKLERALSKLKKFSSQTLYCSNLTVVDKNLKKLDRCYNSTGVSSDFRSLVIQPISAGCTMVFNDELMLLLKKYFPTQISYHDYWISLLASASGTVIYDESSYILYRQHSSNVNGSKSIQRLSKKWLSEKIFGINMIHWNFSYPYLKEIDEHFNLDVANNNQNVLFDILHFDTRFISRFKLLFCDNLIFSRFKKNIYCNFFILFGKR